MGRREKNKITKLSDLRSANSKNDHIHTNHLMTQVDDEILQQQRLQERSDADATAVTGSSHQGQNLDFHPEKLVRGYSSNAFNKVTKEKTSSLPGQT